MNEKQNYKYKNYKFNYSFLKKITYYIHCLEKTFSIDDVIRSKNNIPHDQFHKILHVIIDLLIAGDKALTNKNLASFIACVSMVNDYLLKFSLIFSSFTNDKKLKDWSSLFHQWKNIPIWKLPKKAIENIDESIKSKISNTYIKDLVLFNDFKHLNNIDVIHFHNSMANDINENIDGHNTWIDNNTYHFVVMGILSETLLIVMLNCYTHNPSQLTYSNNFSYFKKLKVNKNSKYLAAPWFKKYLKCEHPKLLDLLIDKDYLRCFKVKK